MIVFDPETMITVTVRPDPLNRVIIIHVDTENVNSQYEHNGDRIPRIRVRVNEEVEGIHITANGKWAGENIAPPLEQLAECAEKEITPSEATPNHTIVLPR